MQLKDIKVMNTENLFKTHHNILATYNILKISIKETVYTYQVQNTLNIRLFIVYGKFLFAFSTWFSNNCLTSSILQSKGP